MLCHGLRDQLTMKFSFAYFLYSDSGVMRRSGISATGSGFAAWFALEVKEVSDVNSYHFLVSCLNHSGLRSLN
jgi:hypothetical protein